MTTSLILAKILGPLYLIVGVGVLINLKIYQKMIKDYLKNAGLVYLGGFLSLLLGLIMITFHNIWMMNWVVIITIFGWLAVIKGIVLIIAPHSMVKLTEPYLKGKKALVIRLVVVVVLGLWLTIAGYSCY